ncbi:uncharacterized protein LOC131241088 isoform X2 [Magnolia sinica]|uniref:uncharacterized protein LOC131241088 isoform X2 n=1 Tax=Magnolia sinica TaxID=86752 RepID=UPI0026582355|nr:uncharacterized protein LOC131241088 isoform X2 [Magnolia sinica]
MIAPSATVGIMEAFLPSPVERTAATALLRLSNLSSKRLPPSSFSCNEESSSSSVSDSCSSLLTTEDSCKKIGSNQLQVLAMAACYREKKWKMVRSRSKKCFRVSNRRMVFFGEQKKVVFPVSIPETEVSSLISGDSSAGSVDMHRPLVKRRVMRGRMVSLAKSTSLRRRAEAILNFLGEGCASELRIREAIGNSPDTSKALRMLLRLEEVKRSGVGGRMDPFLYVVAGPRSDLDLG